MRCEDTLVQYVEHPEATAPVQRIAHEVHGPDLVGHRQHLHALALPLWQAPLLAPWQIQAHGAVHAPHPLVVPAVTIEAQPVEAHPEAPAGMLVGQRVQRIDQRAIQPFPVGLGTPIERRSR